MVQSSYLYSQPLIYHVYLCVLTTLAHAELRDVAEAAQGEQDDNVNPGCAGDDTKLSSINCMSVVWDKEPGREGPMVIIS